MSRLPESPCRRPAATEVVTELGIGLDRADGIYSSGESIAGEVRAVVDDDMEVDALVLAFGIESVSGAHKSRGGENSRHFDDERQRRVLCQGHWTPGTHRYGFQVDGPFGPFSYDGETIRLRWYLQAEIQSARGTPVRSERRQLTLVPGKSAPLDGQQADSERIAFAESPRGSKGCLLVSVLLLLAGLAGTWASVRQDAWDMSGFASIAAGLGLVLVLVNVYQFLVARRINAAEVWIERRVVAPGDRVPCGLAFQVNRPVDVEGISATLVGAEQVRIKRGYTLSGPNSDHVLHEKRQELQLPVRNVPAGVPIRVQGEVSVPANAPFSFDQVKDFGGGVALSWTVEFRVEIKNWPDWVHREAIVVSPRSPESSLS